MAPGRLLSAALLIAGCAPFALAVRIGGDSTGITFLAGFALSWLPVAVITAELAIAIPVAGGPYAWGRVAYGSGWGFVWAWWRALAAVFDVSLVGATFSWLGADISARLGVPGVLISPASVAVIGAVVAAWPTLMWPLAVAGAAAVPMLAVLAPNEAIVGTGAPSWVVAAGAGLFSGAFAMRGADLAGLVVGDVTAPRRTIAWATAAAAAVVVIASVASVVLSAVGGWSAIDAVTGTLGEAPFLGTAVVSLGARAAIGVGVASRLVGAMAGDHYLPKALALREGAGPSRPAIVVVAGLSVAASMLGALDILAGLTAMWVASLALLAGAIVVIRGGHPRLRGPRQEGFVLSGGVEAVALVAAVAAVSGAAAVVDISAIVGARWFVLPAICTATGPAAWVALTIAVKRGRSNRPVPLAAASRWYDLSRPGTPEVAVSGAANRSFEARVGAALPTIVRRQAPY